MIVGMIRYAVPIKTIEFLTNTKTVEDLYEDPYFTDRFNIFCNITLKSFEEQTNKDFILCVYHTNLIPKDRKKLFDNLEKKYSFIRFIYVDGIELHLPDDLKEKDLLTFRLDNDDGVTTDFIEKMQEIKKTSKERNFVISIPNIRKIMRVDENVYKTNAIYYPSNSIGLAYFSTENKTIMDLKCDHRKMCENYSSKIIDGNCGLQIINGYNVGNSIGKAKSSYLTREEMKKLLRKEKYADVDLSCLPIIK